MKANLKGLSGVKGLVLRHGEKILITLAVLLAGYFIYSSLSLPSLDDVRSPDFAGYASLRRGIAAEREYAEWCRWISEKLENA